MWNAGEKTGCLHDYDGDDHNVDGIDEGDVDNDDTITTMVIKDDRDERVAWEQRWGR